MCQTHCSYANTDVLWYWTGFKRCCLNKEASVDGCIHLLLDKNSFCILLVLACSEAVNAANPLQSLGQVHDLLKQKVILAQHVFKLTNWKTSHKLVFSTDHSAVLVLQEQSEKEAGLSKDAATLFSYFITGLLSVSLQQIQQNFHRVFH